MAKNKFNAPQAPLRSSWRDEVFKNPKKRGTYTVYKSLGTGKVFFEKEEGQIVPNNRTNGNTY